MKAQEKSELIIFTLLLPEYFKLSSYYQTLPSEMDEKQKALAMRSYLERVSKNPAGAHLKEPEIYPSGSIDGWLNRTPSLLWKAKQTRDVRVYKDPVLYMGFRRCSHGKG